jgi:uncharacterized membrane protein HdeD (DUF308 family)
MELGIDRSIRHWWVFLIRGLLFIAVGIYLIAVPISGLVALGFLFGLMIFIAGISELLHVYRDNTRTNRGWHLFLGIVDIILGAVLMAHVGTSVDILRIILGIWILLRGFSLISFSRLSKSWLIGLSGIVTIIFGGLIIFNAVFGTITIVILTAIAFIAVGLFNTILAFMLKSRYP